MTAPAPEPDPDGHEADADAVSPAAHDGAWDDALADLAHDLARHAALPVRLLPAAADVDTVRAAIVEGLQRTRRGPQGTVAAPDVWAAFLRGAPPQWEELPGACAVRMAVEVLLAWDCDGVRHDERAAWLAACDGLAVAIRVARAAT